MKQNIFLIAFLFSTFTCLAQADTANARLNSYRDKILLVFYKCNLQDDKINAAVEEKNTNDIEAERLTLLEAANNGMKQMDTMESFDGDPALKFNCRETLRFYKQLAESDIPQVRDFFLTEEKFLAIKKEFEKKPVKKHSATEIYTYNNEVKKYNAAVTHYTQLNNFITNSRKLTLYNWNASQKIFMDAHKPGVR